jgi:UDP-N-acetylmuramyl-tripeptide synthetase
MGIEPLLIPLSQFCDVLAKQWGSGWVDSHGLLQRKLLARGKTPKLLQLAWDTRQLGSDSKANEDPGILFFAQKGARFDPLHHLDGLLAAGCLVVTDPTTSLQVTPHQDGLLLAPAPGATNALLRASAWECLSGPAKALTSIGITGTNGKTSTTSLVAQLLTKRTGTPAARLGTLGFFDGSQAHDHLFATTPDFPTLCTFLNHCAQRQVSNLVMEASSHGLAEQRLHRWQFDVAAITNLTPDHLDFHGTMEEYWQAKKLLFLKHLKPSAPAVLAAEKLPWMDLLATLNAKDHPAIVVWNEGKLGAPPHVVSSLGPKGCVLRYRLDESSSSVHGLRLFIESPEGPETAARHVHAPYLLGSFQAENLMVALGVCYAMGHSWPSLVQLIPELVAVPGRMECVTPPELRHNAPLVIVDYAHSPDALESVLGLLRQTQQHEGSRGRLITVFGCGGDRDPTKRPIMGRLATELSDLTIITSDNPRTEEPAAIIADIVRGVTHDAQVLEEPDRLLAINMAIQSAAAGDIVLIAGKGHESYQIIGHELLPFSDTASARTVLEHFFSGSSSPRGSL